jgi:hypothetical protein
MSQHCHRCEELQGRLQLLRDLFALWSADDADARPPGPPDDEGGCEVLITHHTEPDPAAEARGVGLE